MAGLYLPNLPRPGAMGAKTAFMLGDVNIAATTSPQPCYLYLLEFSPSRSSQLHTYPVPGTFFSPRSHGDHYNPRI